MDPFVEPFVALGRRLDEDYRHAAHAEEAFPELALRRVEEARLHEAFSLDALARWALTTRELPPQHDLEATFGNPPITLFRARRFFVSALVWTSSTTAIHQHAFTGAFQVLAGGSIHARHAFAPARTVAEDLVLGALTCTGVEALGPGDARAIHPGPAGIHALFHLEHPSVSLVVRTLRDERFPIQLTYHPPGLGVWEQRDDPESLRGRQLARTMLGLDLARGEALLAEALASATPTDAFALLSEARARGNLPLALRLVESARDRLGAEVATAFELALREEDRRASIVSKREQVRSPTARTLLAILLNAAGRREALALAGAFAPGRPPAETLVAWLEELSMVKLKLQVGGDAWEPSIFGLPTPDEPSRVALVAELSGRPGTTSGPFFEAISRAAPFAALFR